MGVFQHILETHRNRQKRKTSWRGPCLRVSRGPRAQDTIREVGQSFCVLHVPFSARHDGALQLLTAEKWLGPICPGRLVGDRSGMEFVSSLDHLWC